MIYYIYIPYSCLRPPHVSICCEAEGPDKDDAQLRAELSPQNGWMLDGAGELIFCGL